VYQFHKITNGAHYEKANAYGLANLDEFATIGFGTSVYELGAILDEVPWDVHKLLKLVCHFLRRVCGKSEWLLGSARGR